MLAPPLSFGADQLTYTLCWPALTATLVGALGVTPVTNVVALQYCSVAALTMADTY
jgi:hypothetical protein